MIKKQYKLLLEKSHIVGNWTYLEIPFSVEKEFNSKGRVPVKGFVDAVPFRNSVMPMGNGKHFLTVNLTIQKHIKKRAGDHVLLRIEKDNDVRTVILPKDIKAAFSLFPQIKGQFEKLSYSRRKELLNWINDAKKEETRAKRINKTIDFILKQMKK